MVELSCKTHEHKIDPQMGLLVITKVLLNSFHPLWSEGSLFNLGRDESSWASVTGEVLVGDPRSGVLALLTVCVGGEDARCPIIVIFLPGQPNPVCLFI